MSWRRTQTNVKPPERVTSWAPLPQFLVAGILLASLSPVASAGPNRQVTDANVLYETGQFQEALDIYTGLAEERPDSAELKYNQGAAQFQLGNLKEAQAAFEAAGQLSDNPQLQALAAYNLGNCATRDAQALVQEDPEKAIETFTQSLRHYKDALAKNRDFKPAAENLETTRRVIQQLRQQQQEQEQQQQQQEQQQEDAKEKLDELIDQQAQNNQKSEEAAEQQQDPAQPDPSQEQLSEQADQQQQTREETEQLADGMDDGQEQPSPMDEAKEHAEKAAEKQQEAEEALRNQEPEKANDAQEEALEALKKAREALDQGEEKEGDSSDPQEQGEDGEKGDQQKPSDEQQPEEQPQDDAQDPTESPETPSAEEMKDVPPPDATARDILEQEKKNKEMRNLRQMIRIRPTEKDW